MSSNIKLSIVFLNFNKLKETKITCTALQSLCLHRTDIEIIAVDNHSHDGTLEYLTQQDFIHTILLPENNGVAGYSAGFEHAQGEYILVLDDDSCPESLMGIDHALNLLNTQPKIGLIAAHINMLDGKPQWSWHLPKSSQPCSSPFFIGCGFIIRRALFADIGWYPENFFLYQNEIEVSFQVRLRGYDILYDPQCVVIHRGTPSQRSNSRRLFYPTRNTLWLLRGYYPQPQASYLIASRLIIGLVKAIQSREITAYIKAVYAGFKHPINQQILPKHLRQLFKPFWRQNSLIHQLLKRT